MRKALHPQAVPAGEGWVWSGKLPGMSEKTRKSSDNLSKNNTGEKQNKIKGFVSLMKWKILFVLLSKNTCVQNQNVSILLHVKKCI